MTINISYQDTTLTTFTSGSKILKTAGKYLTDDITINVSNSGGGTSPATQHTLYLEFTDNTNTTISIYCNDSIITTLITDSQPPTSYNGKTIKKASFDEIT